ncbi:MAG: MBOAT family O-acyltransferase, partial [Planctomycetota bacterium]
MLFHTWPFLLFFAAFYALYLALRSTRLRLPLLLGASYIFYGWWNPLYLLLIIYSTLVDYLAVLGMSRGGRKKSWLVLSLLNNLFLLGFFKYGEFVVENLNEGLSLLGPGWILPAPDVLLPVGISFYTFQSMSYTIDYWRGKLEAEPNFIRFASFVALFPQLVAGPIVRATEFLPQLRTARRREDVPLRACLGLFLVGFVKKACVSDNLSPFVDAYFANP